MTRIRNCDGKVKEMKKGPWTRDEDQMLIAYIQKHGHESWRAMPEKAGLQRCGKSCRLRWTNYLSPHIKRGKFSAQEDETIIRLHTLLGNRWSAIATHLPKRTDNEIKNYWNSCLKKRLIRMGIDPNTHKPKNTHLDGSAQSKQTAANISHMAQWETARLEAESRLVRQSKIVYNPKTIALPPPRKSRCLDVLNVWQAMSSGNGLFGLAESLESPTSTLNFSCGSTCTVPAVLENRDITFMASDTISGGVKGNLENSLVANDFVECDYDMSCLMEFKSANEDYGINSSDNWNELLNLVTSSPTKSHHVV